MDCGLLATVLEEQMGVGMNESCVRRALHLQDYTIHFSGHVVSNPDPEYEQKFSPIKDLQWRAEVLIHIFKRELYSSA
ncbi:MAG TPA: hypothetical protein VEH81_12770 [Ktedonobacteraceae bacterium]|nr:hypothetical protein [Ktedonobacteraceae bacterium]